MHRHTICTHAHTHKCNCIYQQEVLNPMADKGKTVEVMQYTTLTSLDVLMRCGYSLETTYLQDGWVLVTECSISIKQNPYNVIELLNLFYLHVCEVKYHEWLTLLLFSHHFCILMVHIHNSISSVLLDCVSRPWSSCSQADCVVFPNSFLLLLSVCI